MKHVALVLAVLFFASPAEAKQKAPQHSTPVQKGKASPDCTPRGDFDPREMFDGKQYPPDKNFCPVPPKAEMVS